MSARQRKAQPQGLDNPPSYEETIKNKPPPQGFVVPGPAAHTGAKTVVKVIQVPVPELGPNPATIQCPHCQLRITTSTSSKPGFMAWFLSAALCFTGFWPCFCVPFMVDSLQNVKHICPSCKLVVGRYQEGC